MTETTMVAVGDVAADKTLLDDRGTPTALSSLWCERPLVLMFVRHLGWTFCRQHVVHVREAYSQFEQVGSQVAVVAMATAEQAAAFRSRYRLPFRLLADPTCEVYRAYGLQRGNLWSITGPVVWAAGLKSIVQHGAGMPVGDPFQLAGTFVIDRDGVIRYEHRAASSAQWPPNSELFEVLQALP